MKEMVDCSLHILRVKPVTLYFISKCTSQLLFQKEANTKLQVVTSYKKGQNLTLWRTELTISTLIAGSRFTGGQ